MVKLENDTNQVQSPIDIAMQMLAGTQDIIFNAILGPQKTERVDMIEGQSLDFVLDTVLQQSQIHGQAIRESQVSAPERPAPSPMPSPMPSPAPPGELPTQPGSPPEGMGDIMSMFGGGM